ncbi:prepilin peptidase [Candidatus Dojkabacteria bacterium]|uniref:Prepilin peptidase n=1 Tax=Candidatus Dojkabacteria bacterium TaxID=2099670 RepID=A0A955RM46_9BACT|nr:prepilin peptidase [Candidatus Dojkabacteria bacterium]
MTQVLYISLGAVINFVIGFVLADLVDEKYKTTLKSLFQKDIYRQVLFGLILSILSIPLIQYYLLNNPSLVYIQGFLISNLMLIIFLFAAYYDIRYFRVLDKLTQFVIFYLIGLNSSVIYYLTNEPNVVLFNNYQYNPLSNLIAGALAWLIFYTIVTITKERGMGSGDIRIATIIGLSLGVGKFILSFYISIFSALLVAGFLYLINRKDVSFKTKIPFVPFLVIGGLLALYLPVDFFDIISQIYLPI